MNKIKFINGGEMTPSKIIGIGLNYVKHIDEMKSIPQKDPVIFLKPNSSLHDISQPIPIPKNHGSVDHEIELAVCIGREGNNISIKSADDYIAGFGLALDLTLRDMQSKAKSAGLPWAIAKGFDHSCPVSQFVEKNAISDYNNLNIKLIVNGNERQNSSTLNMIFKIPFLIHYISQFFTLIKGDLIITGTPEGVGPLNENDQLEASISEIALVKTKII
jgi:2-keto-4-pentenoate hydratase/2-oxohepta-3-ene-1,7-dioic acid hydratase in catechol pathway